MAPRRGGGGGSSSGSVSTCPGAFLLIQDQVYFAHQVLFFVAFLGLSIALCVFRRRSGAGKKLLGLPFIFSILFFLIYYGCLFIGTVLRECGTTDVYSFLNWQLAANIFGNLAEWLLLVVVVFTLNVMLREQLGRTTAIVKGALLAAIGLMGALVCAIIGLESYIVWTQIDSGYRISSLYDIALSYARLRLAYYVLYLVAVLASSGFALKSVMSLRSRRSPAGGLIGWVVALTISMILWILLTLIPAAWTLQAMFIIWDTRIALLYVSAFSQVLSFIFIICIAKHVGWSRSTAVDPMTQHQYAHNADYHAGTYNYQQQPIYTAPKP